MSFVALPHDFDVKTGECRGYQIAMQEDGSDLMPIGFLRGDKNLPVDLGKLSENFAAMLNDRDPMHMIGQTHDMYFERFPEGMSLRFRKDEGVSEAGAMFTLLPGFTLKFEEDLND